MIAPSKYIEDLKSEVSKINGLSVEQTEASNNLPSMIVRDNNGNEVFIEMQDAKSYGELPLATAFQLKKIKEKYPQVLLISLSNVSKTLADTLDNLGINYLVKPSVEITTNKIREIAKVNNFASAY